MNDVVRKNGKILKQDEVGYIEDAPKFAEVVNIKDTPTFALDLKEWEWERQSKINKIIYEVGDEYVFEITKGNKKWTISLDDFFDKVIQICGVKTK